MGIATIGMKPLRESTGLPPVADRMQRMVPQVDGEDGMTGLNSQQTGAPGDREGMLRKLIEVDISLSAERDQERLFENILLEAMKFCNADGGTLYLRTENDSLSFAIMRNGTLGIASAFRC